MLQTFIGSLLSQAVALNRCRVSWARLLNRRRELRVRCTASALRSSAEAASSVLSTSPESWIARVGRGNSSTRQFGQNQKSPEVAAGAPRETCLEVPTNYAAVSSLVDRHTYTDTHRHTHTQEAYLERFFETVQFLVDVLLGDVAGALVQLNAFLQRHLVRLECERQTDELFLERQREKGAH